MLKATRHAPLQIALISVHGDPLLPLGSEEAGGQNVYVRQVARALAARGHRVDVFTRGRHCREIELHDLDGARVVRLPAGPSGFIPRDRLYPHLPELQTHLLEFARWNNARYDLLHSNYWLSGWVGLRLQATWRIPLVHTHHSLGAVKFASEGRLPSMGAKRLAIEEQLGARCGAVVATSPQEEADMRRHYDVTRPVRVIPCGVDDAVFYPRNGQEARRRLGLPERGPLLLYAGRFDPRKGIEMVVRALLLLRERPVHLAIAGGFDPSTADAAEHDRIRGLVAEWGLGDRVTFLGKQQPERMSLAYSAATVCVVPSYYEPFGLVAIESMACGTPVVASRVGGLPYSVQDGVTGRLVPPRDSAALAEACAGLLADPQGLARMGSAGQRRVREQFTWSIVAERLEELYRSEGAKLTGVGAGA